MTFGPKRGHVLFIFENFVRDFGLLIIALVIGLIRGDMDIIVENLGVLVIVLMGPVSRIMQYIFTRYSVDEEKLLVESGWLRKKRLEVPLATITTVDFSQTLLHQIFGAFRLNVDNASNVSETKTRVRMTFGREDAFAVRDLLMKGRKGVDGFNLAGEAAEPAEEGRCIRIGNGQLLLLGALQSKGVFLAELFGIVTTVTALFDLGDGISESRLMDILTEYGAARMILACIVLVFILAVLCGMAGSVIRYYGFRILDNGEAIRIEYGLLTKKRYTIQKNRISGFSFQQSFLMRRFHRGTLQLFAIGYGGGGDEESSEEPMFFPLIEETMVRDEISRILPEMKTVSGFYRPPERSLRYFFYGPGFVLALAALGMSIWLSVQVDFCREVWVLGCLILLYSVCGRVQEFRHSALCGNMDSFTMVSGGFKTCTVFVRTSHVESISRRAGIWKAKKGVANVTAGYIAPLSAASQTVKNVPAEAFDEMKKQLLY